MPTAVAGEGASAAVASRFGSCSPGKAAGTGAGENGLALTKAGAGASVPGLGAGAAGKGYSDGTGAGTSGIPAAKAGEGEGAEEVAAAGAKSEGEGTGVFGCMIGPGVCNYKVMDPLHCKCDVSEFAGPMGRLWVSSSILASLQWHLHKAKQLQTERFWREAF